MTREDFNKHKELIEAWANGALIEYLDGQVWYDVDYPMWMANTQYRIKPQEPKKKTIVLETVLMCTKSGRYYVTEASVGFPQSLNNADSFIKVLSTREVEIDEEWN